MKIRNVAFIAALIGWIALAVYYVTPSESAVAKEIETAPKTVGETLSAIAQSLKHEGEEKRKQLRMDEGKQAPNPTFNSNLEINENEYYLSLQSK